MNWWPFRKKAQVPDVTPEQLTQAEDELTEIRGQLFLPKPGKSAIDFAPSPEDVVGMVTVDLSLYAVRSKYGSYWIVQDNRTKRLVADRSPLDGAGFVIADVLKESLIHDPEPHTH